MFLPARELLPSILEESSTLITKVLLYPLWLQPADIVITDKTLVAPSVVSLVVLLVVLVLQHLEHDTQGTLHG